LEVIFTEGFGVHTHIVNDLIGKGVNTFEVELVLSLRLDSFSCFFKEKLPEEGG
jgi:hypothetical protein